MEALNVPDGGVPVTRTSSADADVLDLSAMTPRAAVTINSDDGMAVQYDQTARTVVVTLPGRQVRVVRDLARRG
ncbi:MAG: hypothetical protein IT305_28255 [Chloroflexi bacterium]|nr:hypothetical protein [Chloroflexota bacterium]